MKIAIIILTILFSSTSYSYVDLNLSYTYSLKRIEGVETVDNDDPGEAVSTSNGASITWAWYIWQYTALELNYGETTERLKDSRESTTSDESVTIKNLDSTLITKVSGVGIRQSFAGRKSSIIPSLSLGYAKYTTSGKTVYTLDIESEGEQEITLEREQKSFNSYYAAFSLKFRITQLMGLTLAAKTVLQDLDADKPSDNVTYSAGLSWVF